MEPTLVIASFFVHSLLSSPHTDLASAISCHPAASLTLRYLVCCVWRSASKELSNEYLVEYLVEYIGERMRTDLGRVWGSLRGRRIRDWLFWRVFCLFEYLRRMLDMVLVFSCIYFCVEAEKLYCVVVEFRVWVGWVDGFCVWELMVCEWFRASMFWVLLKCLVFWTSGLRWKFECGS